MKPLYIDTGISGQKHLYIKKVDTPYLNKPFHFHPNCEMVFIEEGYGKRVIGDHVSNFNEGDLVLMGPNTPHIWLNDDAFYKGNKELRAKAIVIYFSPELLENLLGRADLKSFQALLKKSLRGLVIRGRTKEAIRQKLMTIHEKEGLSQLIDFLSILDMLTRTREVKYLSSEKFVNTYNERDTDRINKVYQFLMQNFKQDIQLDTVAKIVNMAPTAFCRFFKQRTKKTFSRFLNELRIGHACNLLIHPDMTISAICYESGFNNLTNFNKFFKEIAGDTPTKYRKKLEK